MRDRSRFAVLILTHRRPGNVVTVETLRRSGYTGRIYFVIDDEDPTGDEYRARFGAEFVVTFSKAEWAKVTDTADSIQENRGVVYARNAAFQIARDLDLDYFLVLDDDYTSFLFRYVRNGEISSTMIRTRFDAVCDAMLDLLDSTGAVTVAMAQGGDYMGGIGSAMWTNKVRRKAMNAFFFRTDRPVEFYGRINEDVNAYVVNGAVGDLYLTTALLQLNQVQTQKNPGGLTEIYLDAGTYVKSFYTVMMAPSCVEIRTMGRTDRRMHHLIRWDYAVPKIISGKYRKAAR